VLDCLLTNPTRVDEKVVQISHTLKNISHLLILLRPHQARQTLISVLKSQIEQRNAKTEYLETCTKQINEFLATHASQTSDDTKEAITATSMNDTIMSGSDAASAAQSTSTLTSTSTTEPQTSSQLASSSPALRADADRLRQLLDAIE
jgi:MED7 protein